MRKATLISILAALPSAAAYYQGIRPLNTFVQMIANFFTAPALKNYYVQVGVIRFALFLVVFSVANMAFKRVGFENRVAGTVSFVVGFISAFFMPEPWLIATGGTITGLVAAAVLLGVIGTGIYWAMVKLRGNALYHFFGLIILFVLIEVVLIYASLIGVDVLAGGVAGGAAGAVIGSSITRSSANKGIPLGNINPPRELPIRKLHNPEENVKKLLRNPEPLPGTKKGEETTPATNLPEQNNFPP